MNEIGFDRIRAAEKKSNNGAKKGRGEERVRKGKGGMNATKACVLRCSIRSEKASHQEKKKQIRSATGAPSQQSSAIAIVCNARAPTDELINEVNYLCGQNYRLPASISKR